MSIYSATCLISNIGKDILYFAVQSFSNKVHIVLGLQQLINFWYLYNVMIIKVLFESIGHTFKYCS